MSSLSFQPVQDGLYRAVDSSAGKVVVYWLLLKGCPPAGNLDAADTWNLYSGCHLLLPADQPISDPAGFAAALQQKFNPPQAGARWVSWIADPTDLSSALTVQAILSGTASEAQTVADSSLPLANVSLDVPAGSMLGFAAAPPLSPDTPALAFSAAQGRLIALSRSGAGVNLTPDNGQVIVPLSGSAAGSFVFHMAPDRGDFYEFFMDDVSSFDPPAANEVRYFHGAAGSVQTLRYPVFPPESQNSGNLPLDVRLDPLHVWDSERTRFGLDVASFAPATSGGPPLPAAVNFRGTDGHVLALVPQQGTGYAFGARPAAGANEAPASVYAYLTPAGVFIVQPVAGTPGAAKAAASATISHLMCGLTGTEYLLLAPGATVEFIPGQKAYAKDFTAPSSGGGTPADPCNPGPWVEPVLPGALLADDFTTAWVRVNPAPVPPVGVDYGYAVQPQTSVYYSSVQKASVANGDSSYTYPLALGCRVSMLRDAAASAALVPVPVAPYGGVWSTGVDDSELPPQDALVAFESQIIGATRHATAPKDMVNGPTFFDPVTHTGVNGGFAKTPEGLLVQLNDDSTSQPGTLAKLFLAISPNDTPVNGADRLTFEPAVGTVVVSPSLSNAFMNDKLFMVAANYTPGDPTTPLGDFKNEIQVGEWVFQLDVGYTGDQQKSPATILIFKFTTALNVVDLVANAAYWQDWPIFIGQDPDRVQTVQSQLNQMLCTAKQNAADPAKPSLFDDFWAKATDPNWTGILAMNCGIDAAELPPDLQDLLGGIDGQLRAHHFGVTVNQIKGADSTSWDIDQSSLFALIHYDKDYQPPAPQPDGSPSDGFQVLKLNVLFENSALVHFDSRIAVTIPRLFQTDVDVLLTSPSGDPNVPAGFNVIEINGVYQKHGDSGTVIFDTTEPLVFQFNTPTSTGFRVLKEMYLTDAALVPVTSNSVNGAVTVTSHFAMSGVLVFTDDVSAAAQGGGAGSGLDLFSYGNATLTPAAGLGFTAYNIGMTTVIQNNVGTITQIGPDLSAFAVTPSSTPRDQSLVAALPLKLLGFIQGPGSAGWPVTFDGKSQGAFAADYALQFQVSLGSLGALSSIADSLDVDLLLCWKAATGATADQMWLLMVPPQTMLGQLGFSLEGVLDTTFQSVEVVVQTWPAEAPPEPRKVYAIYFKDVQIQILGLSLIPGDANFTLFANPTSGTPSNLGWLMTLKAPTAGD